ncbi:MAG: T9SS type A sorting domain-containing protein, partial [Flavobacterium sp.]
FVYWSSMVEGQTIFGMWMSNASENFYRFNPASGASGAWVGIPGSFVMQEGQGYIARARHNSNGWAVNPPGTVPWTATFTGKPRSGNVPLTLSGDRFHLLGNPYPSAVDFDTFALQEAVDYASSPFVPTIYYWTQSTPIAGNQYNQNDYATYNAPNGTGITVDGFTAGRYIAAGQGFFIRTRAGATTASFTNDYRAAIDGSNQPVNQNFAKPASKQILSANRSRYWLNLNSGAAFKQIAVVHSNLATNAYEIDYDALTFNGNTAMNFYSLVDNLNISIQGRAPMQITDEVPIGYYVASAGTFSISMPQYDGIFAADQDVFLLDQLTNITHNLKIAPYTFTTTSGTHNSRFKIVYQNNPLGVNEVTENNHLTVFYQNQQIHVESSKELLDTIQIFDIQGRRIFDKNNLSTHQVSFEFLKNHSFYFVKVKTKSGTILSHKIVKN